MVDRAPDAARYRAFLSYSHKNSAAAAKLHRRLETYRMPKRLVGTETPRGPVPERLAPIFRDRDEFPAATDLSEEVCAALAESGCLIILCSPAAAESDWVAEEIRTFRSLHPDRPILAAIIDGEPIDCFPESLRTSGPGGARIEPLATDLRPQGDGKTLGLLKLVAGITGVALDALVQRDAARRIRRVTAVTAAAVVAMLMMAALTLVALNARSEAESQRAETEGMVEFMLTDLRRELRGVGRLDIMAAVNDRALAYYDRQRSLGRFNAVSAIAARVDHTAGEDLLTRGRTDAALALFRKAHHATASLLVRSPDDPDIIFAHAQSEYWLGRVHELRQDWPIAQRQYTRFASLVDGLIAADPDNPDFMKQVAWAAVDLGNVQLNGIKDSGAAQRSYDKAVQWFGRAVEAQPDDGRTRLALANAYGWLADSYFMREMWRESLANRLQQLGIVERLYRADPVNLEHAYRRALAQRAVARSYSKVGDGQRAGALMHEAYGWAVRLSIRDPNNGEWSLFKGMVGCELYHGDYGLPAALSREQLAREIRISDSRVRQENQNDFRLRNCVEALK